jgi:two-component system OmpR family sensor kinase
MIRSLRGRLFAGLMAIIVLTGAIGGLFAYKWAFDEAMEIQDSVLIQLASLAQTGGVGRAQPLHGIEEDSEVRIIELGKTSPDSADDRQLFEAQDGFRLATRGGQAVRILLRTRPDGSRYAVTQPTSVRDETAREMAFRTLFPIFALIPCLMLITALVIAYSFRPMLRMAADLDARRAADMTPLPVSSAPSELHPFIVSINGLLARLQLMMDQQRRFVADAAHELRTPITALSLQAENLDPVELSAPARERLTVLKQGIHRTRHLLEQLLALARQEATSRSSADMPIVELDRATRDVVADLMPLAFDRGVDLGFGRLESLAVQGEPVMLATMIRNLIDNALRLTEQGGRIDVGVYRMDDRAVLQIEDTGPGIAPGDMAQVFEPFFRGSRAEGEGSGLGLSIVKRVVDQLRGSIVLENMRDTDRSGLRVTVRLPIAASVGRCDEATALS